MCGRYAIIDGKKVFATFTMLRQARLEGRVMEELPRYNAAPMQRLPVVAVRDGELSIGPMKWWLIPHWSKDGKVNFSTFNAKAETLDQSRLYVPYFKGSRCLIPADAFYEWKKVPVAKEVRGKKTEVVEKHPMCIRMKDKKPFMLAGLFSVWKDAEEKEHPSFSIITTEPNKLMASIHNRMPVILPEKHFEQWLDRDYKDIEKLQKLLVAYPPTKMQAYRVSTVVSNSRNDVPECLEPVKE